MEVRTYVRGGGGGGVGGGGVRDDVTRRVGSQESGEKFSDPLP